MVLWFCTETILVYFGYGCYFFFFFKQKTAYELRISDWSSDVCSSDLYYSCLHAKADHLRRPCSAPDPRPRILCADEWPRLCLQSGREPSPAAAHYRPQAIPDRSTPGEVDLRVDRTHVVQGKSVSERVALGGRRLITT